MKKIQLVIVCLVIILAGCSKITELVPLEIDKTIGKQFSEQVESLPRQGEILDKSTNKEIYSYLEKIKLNILNSGKVKYKDQFQWQLKIIRNDSVLNAFCIAGGYIYVYTGLIKFLDNEAELAGVLAHEIAHADKRHTTIRMVSEYGIGTIIALAMGGDVSFLVNIGRQLLGLSFSRNDEMDADETAITYLTATDYDPRGIAGFFKKMNEKGKSATIPEFLSTHPSSENRIEEINSYWKKLGAKKGKFYPELYADAKTSLP